MFSIDKENGFDFSSPPLIPQGERNIFWTKIYPA
jgi:hypothetical protein